MISTDTYVNIIITALSAVCIPVCVTLAIERKKSPSLNFSSLFVVVVASVIAMFLVASLLYFWEEVCAFLTAIFSTNQSSNMMAPFSFLIFSWDGFLKIYISGLLSLILLWVLVIVYSIGIYVFQDKNYITALGLLCFLMAVVFLSLWGELFVSIVIYFAFARFGIGISITAAIVLNGIIGFKILRHVNNAE